MSWQRQFFGDKSKSPPSALKHSVLIKTTQTWLKSWHGDESKYDGIHPPTFVHIDGFAGSGMYYAEDKDGLTVPPSTSICMKDFLSEQCASALGSPCLVLREILITVLANIENPTVRTHRYELNWIEKDQTNFHRLCSLLLKIEGIDEKKQSGDNSLAEVIQSTRKRHFKVLFQERDCQELGSVSPCQPTPCISIVVVHDAFESWLRRDYQHTPGTRILSFLDPYGFKGLTMVAPRRLVQQMGSSNQGSRALDVGSIEMLFCNSISDACSSTLYLVIYFATHKVKEILTRPAFYEHLQHIRRPSSALTETTGAEQTTGSFQKNSRVDKPINAVNSSLFSSICAFLGVNSTDALPRLIELQDALSTERLKRIRLADVEVVEQKPLKADELITIFFTAKLGDLFATLNRRNAPEDAEATHRKDQKTLNVDCIQEMRDGKSHVISISIASTRSKT